MFVSCAKLTAELALKQDVLNGCDGTPLPAGTEVATCADLANVTVPDATDTVKGKVALNAGTSLPGDATNCTDALTACGLNALLTDPAAGGNAVINNVKALVPLATTTVAGLIEEATGEETRLGATDPNKDDRAVTPGSMSYALQTGKQYNIHLNNTAATTSSFPHRFDVTNGTSLGGSADNSGSALLAIVAGTSTVAAGGVYSASQGHVTPGVTTNGTLAAVYGFNSSGAGTGTKQGVNGTSIGVGGGTNIGVYGTAANGATNWAGYFEGNVAGGAYTTLSDATLKENVEAIDPAKALQFRNGLSWKKYEMFTEQQVEIMQDVTDSEGNTIQVPTGRYQAIRNSQGIKRGLIAQEVLALAQSIGDFTDVVVEVGEYFTLDAQGYPVKDAQGNNIVNKRLGIDYGSVNVIVMAGEQALTLGA
jgi:hypothetical protein